jgi:hypothetical protein
MRLFTLVVAAAALVGLWILVTTLFGADPVRLRVVSQVDGEPVVGAVVTNEGGGSATTDETGEAGLAFSPPHRLVVSAHGYPDATFDVEEIPRQAPLTLTVQPYILQGRVTDQRAVGLVGVTITVDGKSTVSGEFGAFELVAVEPGPVVATKTAWMPTEGTWDGGNGRFDISMEPFALRALRVHERVAGDPGAFDALLRMIEGTAVNGLVFDTKIEDGQVVHDVDVPLARESGAIVAHYDPADVLQQVRARGLYAVTRIVTFQDPVVAPYRPEWAVHDANTGDLWRSNAGFTWLDPTSRDTWEYPIALGVAACRMGFDEIQFDYVRFPGDGPTGAAVYSAGPVDEDAKVATITAFLEAARTRIHAAGCAVSADIFGIVVSTTNPQGIGQRVEDLSWVVDVLSPMIYPSHYGPGWLGLDNPNDHPDRVVTQAIEAGMPRLEGGAYMRPWLQAFFWNAQQVRESIDAAERAGTGWMLWNAVSNYERSYLPLSDE